MPVIDVNLVYVVTFSILAIHSLVSCSIGPWVSLIVLKVSADVNVASQLAHSSPPHLGPLRSVSSTSL